jgi:hypothetical protein
VTVQALAPNLFLELRDAAAVEVMQFVGTPVRPYSKLSSLPLSSRQQLNSKLLVFFPSSKSKTLLKLLINAGTKSVKRIVEF